MKTTIIISMIIAVFSNLNAQTQEWAATFNGPGNFNERASAIVTDASGNVIVTGRTVAATNTSNFCTVKYSPAGIQQWATIYNSPDNNYDEAIDLVADGSGNIFVTGMSLDSTTGYDIVLIKYNSAGIQQWIQSWSNAGYREDAPHDISIDGSGNIYITGESEVPLNTNYVTLKYNSAGVLQWAKQYPSGFAHFMKTDVSGNSYVTGQSETTFSSDFVTIKYNTLGDTLWVRRYGSNDLNERPTGFALDVNGNSYITGTATPGSTAGFLTVKYNSSGNFQWAAHNDSCHTSEDIEADALGNVYVTGSASVGGSANIATIKFNSAGVRQWISIYNYPYEDLGDNANDLELDAAGNIYITGSTQIESGTNRDVLTVKYNNSGVQKWEARYSFGNSEEAIDLTLDPSNNVCVTGYRTVSGNADLLTIKYSQSPRAEITGIIEGFYNSTSNSMIRDSAKAFLRSTIAPYSIIDSAKAILDTNGLGIFFFPHAVNGTNYYIVLKHRNSIDTWSSSGVSFSSAELTYNFSSAITKAYGNNMMQADASPVRFAIFSGDVTRDGFVNLADIIKVSNDGANFMGGYVVSDVNGDESVNLADLLITHNNSSGFVSVKRP